MLKIREKVPAEKTLSAKTWAWLVTRRWVYLGSPIPEVSSLGHQSCSWLLSCGSTQSGWAGWTFFCSHPCTFGHLVMQLAQRSHAALLTVVTIGSPAQTILSSRGGMMSLHGAPQSIPEVKAEDFLRPLLEAAQCHIILLRANPKVSSYSWGGKADSAS